MEVEYIERRLPYELSYPRRYPGTEGDVGHGAVGGHRERPPHRAEALTIPAPGGYYRNLVTSQTQVARELLHVAVYSTRIIPRVRRYHASSSTPALDA
jgi:hypothetical protein